MSYRDRIFRLDTVPGTGTLVDGRRGGQHQKVGFLWDLGLQKIEGAHEASSLDAWGLC